MSEIRNFDFTASGHRLGTQGESNGEREIRYYVNDDSVAKLLGNTLPAILADLVEVAASIYTADRIAVRPIRAPENWRREFCLKIGVRCISDWKLAEVIEELKSLLLFLTGDSWNLQFSERRGGLRSSESQGHLIHSESNQPTRVSLFSGGLDALAGTIGHIEHCPEDQLVCVSVSSNHRQEHHQVRQIAHLRNRYGRTITHIRVACSLESGSEIAQEPTRRTRGMLFLILGAVSALNCGVNRLFIYENGIGAINLPYERVPLGVPNSRAVHPATLNLVSKFLQTVTGQQFSIENRCVFQTKAEMCQHPGVEGLASTIAETFSCDGFPVQRSQRPQCGVCTSCILRRMSLYGAGLRSVDTTGYGCDLYDTNQRINPQRIRGLAAMDWQVARLADGLHFGWEGLMREFPEVREPCMASSCSGYGSFEAVQQQLVGLYQRHVQEWNAFPFRAVLRTQRQAA
jgi:7-cyano-7-deazaguanine synthase in queuosine biosynthesis